MKKQSIASVIVALGLVFGLTACAVPAFEANNSATPQESPTLTPFYSYNIRANAELRAETYLKQNP